ELEAAREMVILQVRQAAFKTQEAVKTYTMTETNLSKADENLRQATIGFREGVMTVDNVMEAQTAWLKANSENIDARIDVYLCDVYLSKVLGTLNPYNN
ncbi:MAG: TolC family protein, partial [Duncaniella sp.]|nr:TolC family protein [Duncaniella sp.]